MQDTDDDNLDAELDALLEQARWPEPPSQAVTQLRGHWRQLSHPRPRRVLRIGSLAAAAVLMLAVGGIWFLWTQDERGPLDVAQRVPTASHPQNIVSPPHPVPAPPDRIVAQAPTPREILAVLAPSSPMIDVRAAVHHAIDADTDHQYAAALASLRQLQTPAVERELALAFATVNQDARRRTAIRLLGELGGPSSAPLLIRVAREEKFAADAMPGVARLGGVESLVGLARAAHPGPRRQAVAQLLAIGEERAVTEFLALVLNDTMRDEALAALHEAPAPPVQRLIAALNDAHVDRRFAAAKSLGALCHRADVGEALRRMVSTNRQRREALAALLSCPSHEAATFINTARARASIDAEVRAVQTELQRIF